MINDATNFNAVRIYPNPAQDLLIVSNLGPGATVEVLDVAGRSLKKIRSDNGDLHIPIGELSVGIHLIRLIDKDGRENNSIFVKE